MRRAPWTQDDADKLNRWQRLRLMHPFTCPNRATHPKDSMLEAKPEGWICPHCDYRQNWAHEFMFRLPKGLGEKD